MLETFDLHKTYGTFDAVKKINLDVKTGEIYGFLGPNGAGKTTTIKMIMGILVPTSGHIKVNSLDIHTHDVQVKSSIGYLPDNPIFHDYLKGKEILQFVAEMHGQSAALAHTSSLKMLNLFSLTDAANEYGINYSMGMKKKLGLACAMIHSPKLLILDEPINGLDPRATKEVQAILTAFTQNGGTVFLSTHLLDMAQKMCARVGVINQGELVAQGTLAEIQHKAENNGSLEELFFKLTDENN